MSMNLITDVCGVSVGHATDFALGSGVTAIVFAAPAVASVAVTGGAPGSRDTDMLSPESTVDKVDAIVLSGGSVFGLDGAGGVLAALREAGRGLMFGPLRLPIAPGAIIFDLANGGDKNWGRFAPYRELGYAAATDVSNGTFSLGTVGAGTGATTATVKGGLGSASDVTPAGHTVGAIVVVNALGAATIGEGPHFWAAPFERGGEFGGRGWPATITRHDTALRTKGRPTPATTIGLVVTDAALSKSQAKRLAIMAHDGLARAVLPAHAPMDGDTIFAAATGARPLGDPLRELTELGHSATLTMARAIARGVFSATALLVGGAQPSWQDRFGTG
jgi:L-aminopeptidase/D-esterase-like protein